VLPKGINKTLVVFNYSVNCTSTPLADSQIYVPLLVVNWLHSLWVLLLILLWLLVTHLWLLLVMLLLLLWLILHSIVHLSWLDLNGLNLCSSHQALLLAELGLLLLLSEIAWSAAVCAETISATCGHTISSIAGMNHKDTYRLP